MGSPIDPPKTCAKDVDCPAIDPATCKDIIKNRTLTPRIKPISVSENNILKKYSFPEMVLGIISETLGRTTIEKQNATAIFTLTGTDFSPNAGRNAIAAIIRRKTIINCCAAILKYAYRF
jgi:hypothetical protein